MENTNNGPPQEVALWRWMLIGVLLIAAVVAGYASGQKAQEEAEAAKYGYKVVRPTPTATVAPKPHTVVKVEEVEVPIQECLTALDYVELLFADVIIPLGDLMDDAIVAAENQDYELATWVAAEMDALQPLASEYVTEYSIAAEQCRGVGV